MRARSAASSAWVFQDQHNDCLDAPANDKSLLDDFSRELSIMITKRASWTSFFKYLLSSLNKKKHKSSLNGFFSLDELQFQMEPAWFPRHCWDQRFFHPGNQSHQVHQATKVKSHPYICACMITRTCRPPSQAEPNETTNGHLWRCCFLDQKKSFSLQLVEHEFQECFRILPRNN